MRLFERGRWRAPGRPSVPDGAARLVHGPAGHGNHSSFTERNVAPSEYDGLCAATEGKAVVHHNTGCYLSPSWAGSHSENCGTKISASSPSRRTPRYFMIGPATLRICV